MLKRIILLSLLILVQTMIPNSKIKAQDVYIDYFYEQLAPYGHWENVDIFGWVWKPYRTQPGWRPYSDGYWVYTDYGWTYQADNDWGWAVYHYGRWAFLDYYGWVWVPGTEWAPAWVAWRNDDNYIGWAPLPPQVEWRHGVGLHYNNFNIGIDIHWSSWCFVDINHFDHPRLGLFIQNTARNVTFMRRTHDITRYEFYNQRIINRSIEPNAWEHMSHRPLVRYNVVEAPSYRKIGVSRNPGRPEIRVYHPQFQMQPSNGNPHQFGKRQDLSSTRRYDKERSKYDKHYDKEYSRLIETQHQEEASPQNNREEVQRQHNAEIDAYREQRSRETRVLETRHINDMDKAVRQNPRNDYKPSKDNNGQGRDRNNDNQKSDQSQPQSQPRRR